MSRAEAGNAASCSLKRQKRKYCAGDICSEKCSEHKVVADACGTEVLEHVVIIKEGFYK